MNNILFIACDTTRADHLGCYGYFRDTSPNIDHVAEEGAVFEDFYTAGAPTGPAYTCMYTGLHAINHKYYAFVQPNLRQIDDTIFTMAEVLSAFGYTTTAIDNLVSFSPHSKHWVKGYDFYVDPTPKAFSFPPFLTAEDVNRRLIPWIKNYSDEEFFLFVHYWDPHDLKNRRIFDHKKGDLSDLKVEEAPVGYRYIPGWGKIGEFFEGKANLRLRGYPHPQVSIDLYDSEVFYMDQAIGEVISTLEDESILDDTLIIITSDHGEMLGQHYTPSDGFTYFWQHASLHSPITHVPLIMRYPKKIPKGMRVKGFGQHIDLLPTIMDLVGAPKGALDIDGKSLLPLLKGEPTRETIYMEQSTRQRAVRTHEWKLICDMRRNTVELYNLKSDPVETINLAETEGTRTKNMNMMLDDWVRNNLKEGARDPMIYVDAEELSLGQMKPSLAHVVYQEKKARLSEAFGKKFVVIENHVHLV